MNDSTQLAPLGAFIFAKLAVDPEEQRATLAGRDMAKEDKAAGVFDDLPSASITGKYAEIYRAAYRECNPAVVRNNS